MEMDAASIVEETLPPTFQDVIMNLQRYWAGTGCQREPAGTV